MKGISIKKNLRTTALNCIDYIYNLSMVRVYIRLHMHTFTRKSENSIQN
jgi:hypothetical protein